MVLVDVVRTNFHRSQLQIGFLTMPNDVEGSVRLAAIEPLGARFDAVGRAVKFENIVVDIRFFKVRDQLIVVFNS